MDRETITNINDVPLPLNFQSNKFKSVTEVDTLNVEYFIGDVDGDDVFQLNDAVISYTQVVFLIHMFT